MVERCANCREKIELGQAVIGAHQGVLGPRGFVPLEEPLLLCTEECTSDHYQPAEKGQERIP